MPQVSFAVVIPAYNEGENIPRVLAALSDNRAAVGPFEVVVVDNLSTDATVERARQAGCRVLENDSGGRLTISALRNRGARAVGGEVLAFLDADMLVPSDWLAVAAERFAGGFQGAFGFVDTVPAEANWVARTWGIRAQQEVRQERAVDFLPGRNLLISRTVFDALGGFDETLTTNEDKDLTYRIALAGFPVLQLPAPPVIHLGYEKSFGEFVRKEFWRQSSTLSFARKHGWAWRTLRNPLLSLAHTVTGLGALLALLGGAGAGALLLLATWLLPSATIAWRGRGAAAPAGYPWQLLWLTLTRWNVSGAALLAQLVRAGVGRYRGRP